MRRLIWFLRHFFLYCFVGGGGVDNGFVFMWIVLYSVSVNRMLELMDRVATVNCNNSHKCCLDHVLQTQQFNGNSLWVFLNPNGDLIVYVPSFYLLFPFSLYLQYVSLLRPPITDSTAGPGADIIDKVEWKQVKSSKSFHIFFLFVFAIERIANNWGSEKADKTIHSMSSKQPKKIWLRR